MFLMRTCGMKHTDSGLFLLQHLKHTKNSISRCNQKLMPTKQSEIQASPQNSPEYSLQGSTYLYSPYILLLYILPYIFGVIVFNKLKVLFKKS